MPLYNEESTQIAKEIFFNDMNDSSLLNVDYWNKRSWISKVKESIVRLFSPLL